MHARSVARPHPAADVCVFASWESAPEVQAPCSILCVRSYGGTKAVHDVRKHARSPTLPVLRGCAVKGDHAEHWDSAQPESNEGASCLASRSCT